MTDEGVFSLAEHAAEKLGSESRALGIKGDRKNRKARTECKDEEAHVPCTRRQGR